MTREMVGEIGSVGTGGRRMGGRVWMRVRMWSTVSVAGWGVVGMAFFLVGAMTGLHTLGSVAYAQAAPNRGDQSPVWQRCGTSAAGIGDGPAAGLRERPEEDVGLPRRLVRKAEDVLVSPYPLGLPTRVEVSALGWEVRMDPFGWAAREARPAAPEPKGECEGPDLWLTGTTGEPERTWAT